MKIIFFGNSPFSLIPLQKLIEQFHVQAIVTALDTVVGRGQQQMRINPVKECASQHNIPVLQPQKLKNNEEFTKDLTSFNADLFVIVSYGKILPKDIITLPPYHTINLHASLLPKLRGAAPIQYALWQGLNHTGNTVQFITEKMDEGDIIAQSIVPIEQDDDYESLEQKLSEDGAHLLSQSILQIQKGICHPQAQDHNEATYTKLIAKEDGAVFLSMTAEDIVNAFRAFHQRPGIYLPLTIGNIKIKDCALSTIVHDAPEGEILALSSEGMIVACYEGSSIVLKTLQAPNKKALKAIDFANGNRFTIGSVLK